MLHVRLAELSILDNLECALVYLARLFYFFYINEELAESFMKTRRSGQTVLLFVLYVLNIWVKLSSTLNDEQTSPIHRLKKTPLIYQVQTRHRSVYLFRIIP